MLFALQTTWFVLIAVLLAGYVLLDGFDLGVGIWYVRGSQQDRRAMLAAVGPVWDGNEVWLITGAGALFASFPEVYATVFSGFYPAMMLLLVSLIFRGAALEFRNKASVAGWGRLWDAAFAVGSSAAALLLGVALGNILRGIALDSNGEYTGGLVGLLNPYALLIGAAGFATMATHGALYLSVKTSGHLRRRAMRWAAWSSAAQAALLAAAGLATALLHEHLLANYNAAPAMWVAPAAAGVLAVSLAWACRRRRPRTALALSAALIVTSWIVAGVGLFPNLVPAANDPAASLTVTNASASELTLKIMLIMAAVGMPVVVAYQWWLYRTFRGPAGKTEGSLEY